MPTINPKWEPFCDYRILKIGDVVRHTKEYLDLDTIFPDPSPIFIRKTSMVVYDISKHSDDMTGYSMRNKYVLSYTPVNDSNGQRPYNKDNFCDLERRI